MAQGTMAHRIAEGCNLYLQECGKVIDGKPEYYQLVMPANDGVTFPPAILATYKTKIIDGNVKALAKVQGHHMNRPELRRHSKWGPYSNSDMMPGILSGLLRKAAIGGQWFDLRRLPDCVTVEPDKSGFMATVHLHG